MKKQYITPSTQLVTLASGSICQMVTGSDGHKRPDGYFKSDEHIGFYGDSDGDDFAKGYDAWSSWDD